MSIETTIMQAGAVLFAVASLYFMFSGKDKPGFGTEFFISFITLTSYSLMTTGIATITATTTDGTNLSAKCIVTVMEPVTPTPNPTDSSDKAVLNITMTNVQVKQYKVTMDTVNKIIIWYRLRSSGSGDPFYEFDITQPLNPNIIRTDYVIFNKISSF